jgi:multimeric flavodoxin WrbA
MRFRRNYAMKILVLAGSYRKNGNTDQIANLIVEHMQKIADQNHEMLEIETVYLGHMDISPCRGCRVCFNRGEDKCPLKDDLLTVKEKMKQADGILLTSPVYVDDVSGIVKNWIDRLAHVCHRPEFAGKCAYLIATVGSSPTDHAMRTMNIALSTWGFHIAGKAGFKTGALLKPDEMRARFGKKTEKISKIFFWAIYNQSWANPSFMSLMMFKIQQGSWHLASPETVDARYWNGKGWADLRRDYYIPHKASRIKVTLARFTGAVIARFVT